MARKGNGIKSVTETIGAAAVDAMRKLGAPMRVIVVGADGWTSITDHDAELNCVKVLLDSPGSGDPDKHMPLTLIFIAPKDRVQVRRIERVETDPRSAA